MRGEARRQRDTWYEILIKQFNKPDFSYGAWLEERRRVLLEASVRNPYFWYSFGMTVWSIVVMTSCAKLWIDGRRKDSITAEIFADLYNQDRYSRERAREAIEKYNEHMELCNRVIEAAESGRPILAPDPEREELRGKLETLARDLTSVTQDRNRLDEKLVEKSRVMAQMSLRIEDLSKRAAGNGSPTRSNTRQALADTARLMSHINALQEELYAERQKNKDLRQA